ncbi:MAG TPA: cation-translocating P-type ATPase, partial [Limnochordales bacterium]
PARRRMSVAWAQPGQAAARVVAKGAPDAVLAVCTHGQGAEGPFPLRPWACRQILEQAEAMAREGLRVLAVAARLVRCGQLPDARRPVEEVAAALERDMTFLGLLGMYDPPRSEVPQAVLRAKQAGVRTLMVTGDHPQTALAVARRVGLEQQGRAVLGSEIAAVSDEALREMVRHHTIFARVAPAEKRRLVRALKAEGHVVAMTGDGVNDAPALQEADIGVAMGLAGTEVARRAASVVLADDNYATIVEAIEEGRAVYENIRRFIRYLLGCNVGEVLVMLAAGVAGLPVPLLPLQLLWVNLVTDGLPALALGMLPASPRLMRRPPRPRAESLFARGTGEEVAAQGLLSGLSVLLLYSGLIAAGTPLERARTAAFTALVACQLLYALQCAGQAGVGLRRLDFVGAAVLTSALLQLAVLALPPLARVFGTVWPSPQEWLGVGVASVGLVLLRAAIDGAARALLRLWAGEPRRVGVGPGP